MLLDNHNRRVNYLRLAVTDRCNLRCNYCMPAEGIDFEKRANLLTISEMIDLSTILVGLGVDKIRITGGEPFARKNLMVLLERLTKLEGLKDLSITTNASLIAPYITTLKKLGISNINVSLDAIDRQRFFEITRRDCFDTVMENLYALIEAGFNVRLNCVVLDGQNTDDILPMVALTEQYPISVRFLEEMPFNGGTKSFDTIRWDYKKIFDLIKKEYSNIIQIPSAISSTSINYKIKGWRGSFGLIPSFSRTFCGSCNRLRVSARGDVMTCLYANPYVNLRDILRANQPQENIQSAIVAAIAHRAKDGFEAEKNAQHVFSASMTSIGG